MRYRAEQGFIQRSGRAFHQKTGYAITATMTAGPWCPERRSGAARRPGASHHRRARLLPVPPGDAQQEGADAQVAPDPPAARCAEPRTPRQRHERRPNEREPPSAAGGASPSSGRATGHPPARGVVHDEQERRSIGTVGAVQFPARHQKRQATAISTRVTTLR